MSMTVEQKRKLNVAYDHAMSPHVALDHTHGGTTEEPPPTPDTRTLQQRIDAAAAGSTLDLTGQSYSAGAVIAKPLTLIGPTIRGPQGTVYSSGQMGIYIRGTASSPIPDVTLRRCAISKFGNAGIHVEYASGLVLEDNDIADCVYAGIMVISGMQGSVSRNKVSKIGVSGAGANSNNAYGIAITQLVATSIPSSDVAVEDNIVTDVPTWQGLDTHGGQRITFRRNTVKGCRDGIYVTGWATTGRARDNVIADNWVENTIGSNQYGITSVYSTGGSVTGNTIKGWMPGHEILKTSGGDPAATAINLAVSGNVIS